MQADTFPVLWLVVGIDLSGVRDARLRQSPAQDP
jgi:hypothetical protein